MSKWKPSGRRRNLAVDPTGKKKDTDYVFITFILDYLPHGMIGLLVATFFAAALSAEGRRTQCAGLDDHRGFLPARDQT